MGDWQLQHDVYAVMEWTLPSTVDELLPLADTGNVDAQLELGYKFYTGMGGVPKDLPRSTSYFERAATAGQPDAQFELGVRFERGWGIDKDPALALEWFL